jgi:hypothetical protein
MWIFDDIANFFMMIGHYSNMVGGWCHSIPLLGDWLGGFFDDFTWVVESVGNGFYELGNWANEVWDKLGDIVSWDTITGLFSNAWNRVTEYVNWFWSRVSVLVAELWSYVTDHFAEIWRYITDHLAELRTWATESFNTLWTWTVGQVVRIWRWIADFPSHAAEAIWQWLQENLFAWLKDRAAQVVNTAGSILEAVW